MPRRQVDPSKVDAIVSLPMQKLLDEARDFYSLASFYQWFIKNFSSIVTLITECMKGDRFEGTDKAQRNAKELKRWITKALMLALRNFNLIFEADCDASNIGIGTVFSQEGFSIAFYIEKLNDAKLKY